MRITFTVTAEIDPAWLYTQTAPRIGIDHDAARAILRRKIDECENALADALMHKDGIVAGSVTVELGEI